MLYKVANKERWCCCLSVQSFQWWLHIAIDILLLTVIAGMPSTLNPTWCQSSSCVLSANSWLLSVCKKLVCIARLLSVLFSLFAFPESLKIMSNDKGRVKNVLYPDFSSVSIARRLVLSCSLLVLLAWSNPFLLSRCPFVSRLSPWLVFQWRIINCVWRKTGSCEKD